MALGTLQAFLKLNIQQFTKQLGKAQAQMSTFAKNMSTSMAAATNSVKGLGGSYKDVSKIVQGIFVSKAIYGTMNAIKDCTGAVWEFQESLEYAEMSYSNLFGSTALAKEFINVLQDAAAISPFQFTDLEQAAGRLKAYGIETKNLMYVTEGVMAAAAAQGSSKNIESISRAIGQIYTKGTLKAEEARQLAEAGIPVYEILAEKLGLTQEQLGELADQAIPASTAINALVDGINERFGGVLTQSSQTMRGLISNIVDNLKMIGSDAIKPVFSGIKKILQDFEAGLLRLRKVLSTSGWGGVLKEFIPPGMQESVRLLVANLIVLGRTIAHVGNTLKNVFVAALPTVINFLNIFLSTLNAIFAPLAHMASILTSDANALKVLSAALAVNMALLIAWKAKAIATFAAAGLAKLFHGITASVLALSKALTFLLAHPVWGLLAVAGALFMGMALYSDKARNALNGLLKSLTAISGINMDKLLMPSQKERANDLDKFNKKLDGTADAMDDLADSTGKAVKAAKGLLAFDEVFKLHEPDEGTDKGFGDITIPEMEIPEMDFDMGDWMPEEGDFSLFGKGFAEKLMNALKEHLGGLDTVMASVIGGLLGAAIGKVLGHTLLGAAIGALAGGLWMLIANKLGLTGEQKGKAAISTALATVLGAAIGAVFGGPAGAKIGAAIGALVGSFWGLLSQKFGITNTQKLSNVINSAISGIFAGVPVFIKDLMKNLIPVESASGAFLGFAKTAGWSLKDSLVKGLKAGIIGAITSLGVGMLSDLLIGWLKTEFELTEQDIANSTVGDTIGNIVGSITGAILGGPIGSIVGGALGQLAGSIVGAFWDTINTTLHGTIIGAVGGLPIGALVGTLAGSIGGPLGAALGAAIGGAIGTAVGAVVQHWDTLKAWFSTTMSELGQAFVDIGSKISGLWEGISTSWSVITEALDISGILDGVVNSISTGASNIAQWFEGIKQSFSDFVGTATTLLEPLATFVSTVFSDIGTAITTVFTDAFNAVTTVVSDIFLAITTVFNDLWVGITTVFNDILTAVTTVSQTIFETASQIWYLIRDLFVMVLSEIWNAVVNTFSPIFEFVSNIFMTIQALVTTGMTLIYTEVSTWLMNAYNTVVERFNAVFTFVSQILTTLQVFITTNLMNWVTSFTSTLASVYTTVTSGFASIQNFIGQILNTLYVFIMGQLTNWWNAFANTVSNIYNSVSSGFSGVYNTITSLISNMYSAVTSGINNIYNTFTNWISNLWNNVFNKLFGWIQEGISKLREFFGLSSEASSISFSGGSSGSSGKSKGHATGGVFNREHIARFAEGNKAEAIIPLENSTAMQPFVDAVADGLTATLAPMLAGLSGGGQQQQLQPLYVGTLIADERGLKELERRMEVIRVQEGRR